MSNPLFYVIIYMVKKMGLLSFILGISEAMEDDKKKKQEKEMDLYGLTDEERELVRRGEYEPWNFEEPSDGEELDEDDYYSEDDF